MTTKKFECSTCRARLVGMTGVDQELPTVAPGQFFFELRKGGKFVAWREEAEVFGQRKVVGLFCAACGGSRVRHKQRSSRTWRALGFAVVIRLPFVYLVPLHDKDALRSESVMVYRTSIDAGKWMSRVSLLGDWSVEVVAPGTNQSRDLAATLRDCYCSSVATGCDFCNGARTAPSLVKED